MALLFCDSFDHYATADIFKKWTGGAGGSGSPLIAAVGRNGTNGLRLDSNGTGYAYVFKDLPAAKATLIAGLSTKFPGSGGDWDILSFEDSAAGTQIKVTFISAGSHLAVYRGGTLLATGTTVMTGGVTYHIALKATIHNTTGSYTLKINDTVELTASGVNTRGSGTNNSADRLKIGNSFNMGVGWSWYHDDLYLCDDSGAQGNDFLGDVRVQAQLPNGEGANNAWTPNSGTVHNDRVKDATPDDDTTYLVAATPGNIDTWAYGNTTPGTTAVKGIQIGTYARKDDAGVRTIAPVLRIGGVDYVGADLPNLSTTYQWLPRILEVSPATGVAFTKAELDGMEAGVKVTA